MRLRRGRLELSQRSRGRAPGGLTSGGTLAPVGQPGPSRWLRRSAALLVPLLVGVALLAWLRSDEPTIEELRLAGPRAPACLRLVIMPDMSGSMSEFTAVRDAAFTRVVRWSATNLRPDDELVVIPWAGSAAIALGPTLIRDVVPGPLPPASIDSQGTNLVAAVDAVRSLPSSDCHDALVVLTDSIVDALPPGLSRRLVRPTVTSVTVVLPAGTQLTETWRKAMPFTRTITADPNNAGATARSLGEVVAFATGQRLERVRR